MRPILFAIVAVLMLFGTALAAEPAASKFVTLLTSGWHVVSATPAGRMGFDAIAADGSVVRSNSPGFGHYIYLQKDEQIAFCITALDRNLVDSCKIYGGGQPQ
jgi:hypothetical protein